MRTRPARHRATALATASAVLLATLPPNLARAQPVGAEANGAAADPPARAGRIARIDGTVSFHGEGAAQWEPASLNFPVTSGGALWTEPQSGAAIEVGATSLDLAPSTELDVTRLDDHLLAATEAQGELYLRVRDLAQGDEVALATPRGTVAITVPGRYGIVAGDTDHPTTVTVVEGAAHIGTQAGLSLNVGPHQTASLTGDADVQGSVGPEQDDAYLADMLGRERTATPRVAAYRPAAVVQRMTGADALETTGSWAATPQYGEVWYPPVERDWVPYRHGHWAWVAPWGWSWVDDASWGFAPSHYGRWVEVGDRWGWTPVVPDAPVVEQPVYAPALVSWVDVGAAAAVGAVAGVAAAAAIGWIPLGPREPYRPPYRASERYWRDINRGQVRDVTNITTVTNNTTIINNFVNRGAATVVPQSEMVGSRPLGAAARPVPAAALAQGRAVLRPAFQPTVATAGVTPPVARALNLAAPTAAARPAAPGPTLAATPADRVPLRPPAERPSGSPTSPAAPVAGLPVPSVAAPSAAAPSGPSAAAIGGAAVVGGAAALGGAALLRSARPATPPTTAVPGNTAPANPAPGPAIATPAAIRPGAPAGGLPPLAAPRPLAAPASPGSAPGPAIRTPQAAAPQPTVPLSPSAHPAVTPGGAPGPAIRPPQAAVIAPGATSPAPSLAPAASIPRPGAAVGPTPLPLPRAEPQPAPRPADPRAAIAQPAPHPQPAPQAAVPQIARTAPVPVAVPHEPAAMRPSVPIQRPAAPPVAPGPARVYVAPPPAPAHVAPPQPVQAPRPPPPIVAPAPHIAAPQSRPAAPPAAAAPPPPAAFRAPAAPPAVHAPPPPQPRPAAPAQRDPRHPNG